MAARQGETHFALPISTTPPPRFAPPSFSEDVPPSSAPAALAEPDLPERFIQHDADRNGHVQATHLRAEYRDCITGQTLRAVEETRGQALRLAAKYHAVAGPVRDVGVFLNGPGAVRQAS